MFVCFLGGGGGSVCIAWSEVKSILSPHGLQTKENKRNVLHMVTNQQAFQSYFRLCHWKWQESAGWDGRMPPVLGAQWMRRTLGWVLNLVEEMSAQMKRLMLHSATDRQDGRTAGRQDGSGKEKVKKLPSSVDACTHTRTNTRTCTHAHAYTGTHTHTHMDTHAKHMHINTHARKHTHTGTHNHTHAHTHISLCFMDSQLLSLSQEK